MGHNYWALALESGSQIYWAHELLLKSMHPRDHGPQEEMPLEWEAHSTTAREQPPFIATKEKPGKKKENKSQHSMKTQQSQN